MTAAITCTHQLESFAETKTEWPEVRRHLAWDRQRQQLDKLSPPVGLLMGC